ncbi:glycosyltransferase [Streptomyces sp. SID1121]|uniref:glycosyltransferase n=1 Tax=Streptomyces sp. SID1121 TaxID=3425888 RepID=UPI00405742F9
MRILFTSTPALGHLIPLLSPAHAARRAGHEVALLTSAGMKGRVTGDLPVLAAGPMPEEIIEETRRRHAALPTHFVTQSQAITYFVTHAEMAVDEALERAGEWRPDLIVSERSDLVGPLLAAHLSVPWSVLALGPAMEDEVRDQVAEAVAPLYQKGGVAPVAPFAYLDICPLPLQTPGWIPPASRVTLRPEPYEEVGGGAWEVPRFPGREGLPLVLVTLGTVYNKPEVLGVILEALRPLRINVVATLGSGKDADAVSADRNQVRTVDFVPLEQLLTGVSTVVSVGGAGTTLATLGQGIPLVLVPQGADHPRNAARTSAAGVSVVVEDAGDVAAGVTRVLEEAEFRARAGLLAEDIRAMNSPERAVEELLTRLPR